MNIRRFALFSGIAMLVMGILSFIPALSQSAATLPTLKLETSYGMFWGIFPMNIVNKLALIGFGVAGVLAARAALISAAVNFSRTVAIVMGAFAIFGFIPTLSTLFGYAPLFGGEIVTHAFFATLGAYFGYAVNVRDDMRTTAQA